MNEDMSIYEKENLKEMIMGINKSESKSKKLSEEEAHKIIEQLSNDLNFQKATILIIVLKIL